MLFAWWLMLSGEPTQPQSKEAVEAVAPGLKRCPDGSVLRVTDQCIEWPDHRYLLTHEPPRRARVERWWCGSSRRPSEASITIEQRQPATPQGSLTYAYRLDALQIEGRPAPKAFMRSVRKKMADVEGIYDISGRCLFVRSRGAVPMLVLLGFANGRRQSSEIRLR